MLWRGNISRSHSLSETLEVWRGSGSQERFGNWSLGVGRQRLVLVFSIFKFAFYFCVLYMRFLFLFSEYIYPFLFHFLDTVVDRRRGWSEC